MTELWEILLPHPHDWPEDVEHVASMYLPYANPMDLEVVHEAKQRFGRQALAYRRIGSERWTMITHERIY